MSKPTDESCANCRFREHVKGAATPQNLKPAEGDECRRHGPQVMVLVQAQGMQLFSIPGTTFPTTLLTNWCGDWAPEPIQSTSK